MRSNSGSSSHENRVSERSPPRQSPRLAQIAKVNAVACVDSLPSPESDIIERSKKRKRSDDWDHTALVSHHQKSPLRSAPAPRLSPTGEHSGYGEEVNWPDYFEGHWPPLFTRDTSMSRAVKRLRSESSYNQKVRDGHEPPAWTRQHEENMMRRGLIMEDFDKQAELDEKSRELCKDLLEKHYSLPDEPSFGSDRFMRILGRARYRNEARVVRDILPYIVPSPELLYIDGCTSLSHVCEAMNSEWTQCETLCGPKPKPDFVVGVSPSAFSDEEICKLKISHDVFPESMFFPFLIAEVKGSDRPVAEAERQAMHSASIASNELVKLYKKTSLISQINQTILVFSVAHDPLMVKIFGHFVKLDGNKVSYFRRQIFSGNFAAGESAETRLKAYQISRAIYDHFYPKHLARIRKALSELPNAVIAPFTARLELEDDSLDSMAEDSSQREASFKMPELPLTAKLRKENDKLLDIIRKQQAEGNHQRTELLEQMAQQREQMERQMAQYREQMEQQKEIIKLLKEGRLT